MVELNALYVANRIENNGRQIQIDEEMYKVKLISYKDVYIGFVYHMFIDNPRQLV